ncbi:LysE family translocator [Desulfosediminicola sp.]|uniref:LysE family translocator n=1 Tax=Desulfosediminicola sp. TaxID=2886825 RepID=UPI003AF30E98
MIELTLLPLYLGALIVAYVTPGPDMALVLAVSASRGKMAGFRTVKGFAVGRAIHVLGSGAGLAVLFTSYPGLQMVVRILGAVYLLNWAWKIARAPVGLRQPDSPDFRHGSDMWRGFLTSLLNPKAVLFCSMLLPQFVSPATGSLFTQFMVLGLLLVIVGFIFDCSYVVLSDWLTRTLSRNISEGSQTGQLVERCRNYLMVTVLGGVALLLLKA